MEAIPHNLLECGAVGAATLPRLVSVLPKSIDEKVHLPSCPVDTGWKGSWSVARALPLSTEVVGWDHWLAEDGPASGCSYASCGGAPATYDEAGNGTPNGICE